MLLCHMEQLQQHLSCQECNTNFGLDEECSTISCEADLCLLRQEGCDTNLGQNGECSTISCEADLRLLR